MAIVNPILVFRAAGFLRTYLLDSSQLVIVRHHPFALKQQIPASVCCTIYTIPGFLPGGGVEDAFFEKVVGEELTGHWQLLVGVGGVCGVVYPRGGCCASSGGYGRLDRGSAAARSVPVQGFAAAVVFGPLIHAWV